MSGRWDSNGGAAPGGAILGETISTGPGATEVDHDVFIHEMDAGVAQINLTFNEVSDDHGTIHRFYVSDITAGACSLSFPTLTFEGVQNIVNFNGVGDSVTLYIDVTNSLAVILGERSVTYS